MKTTSSAEMYIVRPMRFPSPDIMQWLPAIGRFARERDANALVTAQRKKGVACTVIWDSPDGADTTETYRLDNNPISGTSAYRIDAP